MRLRPRDEYQYAAEFGLVWPLTLASSPLPPPAEATRPRFAAPDKKRRTIVPTTREPPDPEPAPGEDGKKGTSETGDGTKSLERERTPQLLGVFRDVN